MTCRWPPPQQAAALLVVLAVCCAVQPCLCFDYLPFRAPDGCTEVPFKEGVPLGGIFFDKAECSQIGAGWAYSRSEAAPNYNTWAHDAERHYCKVCQPGLDRCILKWFGTAPACCGECPDGWTPVGTVPNSLFVSFDKEIHYGENCDGSGTGKVLCKLCGRKECNGCSYTWRGTAPSCYDTCEQGETVVATDTYGDGASCSADGYGHRFLCEKCASSVYDMSKCTQPSGWQGTAWMCRGECGVGQYVYSRDKSGDGSKCWDIYGWKVRCQTCPLLGSSQASAAAAPHKRCYRRKCGTARHGARFTDKPAFQVPGVRSYAECCKVCRTVTGCLRFHVGPSGCSIYRSKPKARTVRSKRFTAAYYELAAP